MLINWLIKMKGKIKWFDIKKGFGFITGEDNKEYFVHYTALPNDYRPKEEENVLFEAKETDKGIQAQNVRKDEGAAEEVAEEAFDDEEVSEESADDEESFDDEESDDEESFDDEEEQ